MIKTVFSPRHYTLLLKKQIRLLLYALILATGLPAQPAFANDLCTINNERYIVHGKISQVYIDQVIDGTFTRTDMPHSRSLKKFLKKNRTLSMHLEFDRAAPVEVTPFQEGAFSMQAMKVMATRFNHENRIKIAHSIAPGAFVVNDAPLFWGVYNDGTWVGNIGGKPELQGISQTIDIDIQAQTLAILDPVFVVQDYSGTLYNEPALPDDLVVSEYDEEGSLMVLRFVPEHFEMPFQTPDEGDIRVTVDYKISSIEPCTYCIRDLAKGSRKGRH